ncbi:hypothetical protein H257_01208 [Aphanomyces astaci]|uniref:Uncharacterized protein n=1 Tax=Aphanomyces astaci TaxID=112090 RepID=W4H6T3_APHAT|nr:hypothetical protein H257_01208 [Aphanomyces astaci]ETV87735.1 hypothetical protein H257_01208 [Aphanomyces astaci]|eukprot:XP_009822598.1 hypothetical protein H257_01208 [Aphanomyces astaci]
MGVDTAPLVAMPPMSWAHQPAFRTKGELLQGRRKENLRVASKFSTEHGGTKAKSNGRRYVMSGAMHPRPHISTLERGQVDHIVFDDDEDRTPTKTRSELHHSRREADLRQLQSVYRSAGSGEPQQTSPPLESIKMSKADKAQRLKDRAGRTRTNIQAERAQERVSINQIYQALLAQAPVVVEAQARTAAIEWWKREPGYVEDPSGMVAASHRVRKSTSHELKFDGSKTRTVTVEELLEKRAKCSQIPGKITQTTFRPSTAGARVPHNVKWTNAIIQFSRTPTENAELMDKYDLKFKGPLDSSFTKDKLFREDRIKGLPQRVPTPPVNPHAIDRSAKATNKLLADCASKRLALNARKAARGSSSARVEAQVLQPTYSKAVTSAPASTVRASGFDHIDVDRILHWNANASVDLAIKKHGLS